MTTAQIIALVMIATSKGGATSQRLGDFYDMEACQNAAARAALVHVSADVHVSCSRRSGQRRSRSFDVAKPVKVEVRKPSAPVEAIDVFTSLIVKRSPS